MVIFSEVGYPISKRLPTTRSLTLSQIFEYLPLGWLAFNRVSNQEHASNRKDII